MTRKRTRSARRQARESARLALGQRIDRLVERGNLLGVAITRAIDVETLYRVTTPEEFEGFRFVLSQTYGIDPVLLLRG